MKATNKLKAAAYDLCSKDSYFSSLIRYLTFIIAIVFITAIISASITNYYNKLIYGDMYDCRISYKTENAEDDPVMGAVSGISELTSPIISSVIDVPSGSGNKMDEYIGLDRVTLKTDSAEYKGFDDRTFRFNGNIRKHAMLGVNCFLEGYSSFSDIQKQVFEFYYDRELVSAGREMSVANEMMMSDYILEHFGITDYSQVLGRRVSLYIDDVPYISDYTLTGIVDSDFYKIVPEGMKYDFGGYNSQVLLCCNAETIKELGGNTLRADFYPRNYSDLPAVIKSINERNLNSELEYEESAGSQYLITYNVKRISGFIIFLLVLFIALAMCLQIISVSSNNMKGQEQYFAMLRAIGIKKGELCGIILIEHFFVALASSLIALVVSVFFLLASNICFVKVFGDGISVGAGQLIKMSICIIFPVMISYLLLITAIFVFEQRRTVHEMLK